MIKQDRAGQGNTGRNKARQDKADRNMTVCSIYRACRQTVDHDGKDDKSKDEIVWKVIRRRDLMGQNCFYPSDLPFLPFPSLLSLPCPSPSFPLILFKDYLPPSPALVFP